MTNVIVTSVFTLVGSLAGFVVGLVVEYLLRRRGELRREIRAWTGGRTGGRSEYRSIEVRLFNDKDVSIALWDAETEFYEGENLIDALSPKEAQGTNPPVGPIDVPSRHSVYVQMIVEADGELLDVCCQVLMPTTP
jgi:hypothetical protein